MEAGPDLATLLAVIDRGTRSLSEAIELAAITWRQPSAPRPGEYETWTPQFTAAHVIGAHVSFARAVAETIGVPPPDALELDLSTPAAALASLESAVAAARPVLAEVRPEHLALETLLGDDLAALLTLMGNHLRAHSRQILGLDASQRG